MTIKYEGKRHINKTVAQLINAGVPERDILKQNLVEGLAAMRYRQQKHGLMFREHHVRTDTESRGEMQMAYANLRAGVLSDVNFKTNSGWLTLDVDSMLELVTDVARHVQRCFDVERYIGEHILALNDTESIREFDISTQWQNHWTSN